MNLLIVTGKSGAGKSTAVSALEDLGFYCVDNMPPELIPKIAEICAGAKSGDFQNIAVVTDTRGGVLFNELSSCLCELNEKGFSHKILFLDADDTELVRRFKETRRRHPLSDRYQMPVDKLIEKETQYLSQVYETADYIINTTMLKPSQLRERISKLFRDKPEISTIQVHCISFGFKYGPAHEADLLFDVRCFQNPFYFDELRSLTGNDTAVRDFVLNSENMPEFIRKTKDFIDFMLPLYVREGKSQLVIAFGCTGGKHRSVTCANVLYEHIKENMYHATVSHRDIGR